MDLTTNKDEYDHDPKHPLHGWLPWILDPERVDNVWKGTQATAHALKRLTDNKQSKLPSYLDRNASEDQLFRSTMGHVVIELDTAAGAGGQTFKKDGYTLIQLYGVDTQLPHTQYNIVHEYGHVIDQRSQYYGRSRIDEEVNLKGQYGPTSDFNEDSGCPTSPTSGGSLNAGLCRQHSYYLLPKDPEAAKKDKTDWAAEEWADRFLFWVYDDRFNSPRAKERTDTWVANVMGVAYGHGLDSDDLLVKQAGVTSITKSANSVVLREMPSQFQTPSLTPNFGAIGSSGNDVKILGKDASGKYLFVVYAGYTGWIQATDVKDLSKEELAALPPISNDYVKKLTGREYSVSHPDKKRPDEQWTRVRA